MISGTTRLFGILGNPVAHSLSPAMHNAALRARGIDAVYIPLKTRELAAALTGIRALPFFGVSVTVPYKVAIMPLLDAVDPVATRIGAVNTLLFRRADGSVHCSGINTDWIGSNQALGEVRDLAGASALVLGAGGAARAIAFGLKEAGVRLFIHNRGERRGRELALQLGCPFVDTEGLRHLRADILVNATSVGMEPEPGAMPLAAELLPHFQVVMDSVYAPLETRLLREAAACGATTVPGSRMLLYQAAAQWRLWLEEEAPLEVMHAALEAALAGKRSACESV